MIIVIINSEEYDGVTVMWSDGSAIAMCPKSIRDYPYDFRGIVQHEAGGHAFGKLGDEYIYYNAFMQNNLPVLGSFRKAKQLGWYQNLSETGDPGEVPWNHLLYHPKYSNIVDIYEGGFYHTRGVFRSETTSCMNNNIPYYSAISRQAIVERIMEYAGQPFSLEEFYSKDVLTVDTRSSQPMQNRNYSVAYGRRRDNGPIIMNEKPEL